MEKIEIKLDSKNLIEIINELDTQIKQIKLDIEKVKEKNILINDLLEKAKNTHISYGVGTQKPQNISYIKELNQFHEEYNLYIIEEMAKIFNLQDVNKKK